MTKKDYELIATEIWRSGFVKPTRKTERLERQNTINIVAYNLANALAQANPKFNRSKFLASCGLSSENS